LKEFKKKFVSFNGSLFKFEENLHAIDRDFAF